MTVMMIIVPYRKVVQNLLHGLVHEVSGVVMTIDESDYPTMPYQNCHALLPSSSVSPILG